MVGSFQKTAYAFQRSMAGPVAAAFWLAALFASPPVQGQSGIKIGLTASGYRATHSDQRVWSGEDYRPFFGYEVDRLQEDGYPRVALQVGAFHTVALSGRFALQPELHVALRGVRFSQMDLYGESFDVNASHLQLPLLLRYDPTHWAFRPRLLFGPYASVVVAASRELTVWGESDTKDLTNLSTLDYGLVFGVENAFNAWSRPLMLEVRAEWGLASCMTQSTDFIDLHEDPGRINLVALSLLLGYGF